MKKNNTGIGLRVSKQMEVNGMTAEDIASLLKISPSQARRLINDQCAWDLNYVCLLSDYFQVSTDYLTSGKMDVDKQIMEIESSMETTKMKERISLVIKLLKMIIKILDK